MTVIRANDPKKNLEARFIELWFERYGEKPKTIAEVIKEIHAVYENRREVDEEHQLNEVFTEAGDGALNVLKIGWFCNGIANRVINKKVFYKADIKRGTARWAVRSADLGDHQ
jgi:hypothetical protein